MTITDTLDIFQNMFVTRGGMSIRAIGATQCLRERGRKKIIIHLKKKNHSV